MLLASHRAVNLYLEWHVVKSLISYLSKPFREAKKEFSEVLSGQQQIVLSLSAILFVSTLSALLWSFFSTLSTLLLSLFFTLSALLLSFCFTLWPLTPAKSVGKSMGRAWAEHVQSMGRVWTE